MQTQLTIITLQKTMVVVEGVARKLNPNTNIWSTSKPVTGKMAKRKKDHLLIIFQTQLKRDIRSDKKITRIS